MGPDSITEKDRAMAQRCACERVYGRKAHEPEPAPP